MIAQDDGGEPQAKRRKVRKSTLSCRECQRRKVCCSLGDEGDGSVCVECRRRGTACIGQEFDDEPSSAGVEERLGRVEPLVERLASREFQQESVGSATSPRDVSHAGSGSRSTSAVDSRGHSLPRPTPVVESLQAQSASDSTSPKNVMDHLMAAWPSPDDLTLMRKLPKKFRLLFESATCTPFSGKHAWVLQDTLKQPPPNCTPVYMARKLLLVASYLLSVRSGKTKPFREFGVAHRDSMMNRAARAAHDEVTSDDELISSLEGIECLLIESMYHNNMGNLRQSWLATRRGILFAQLLGLHRGGGQTPSCKDPSILAPGYIWFRLVQMDHYLSLILGLPLAIDSPFMDYELYEDYRHISRDGKRLSPDEKMQRVHCEVAARIIRRKSLADEDAVRETAEIDELLERTYEMMPGPWWLAPTDKEHLILKDEASRNALTMTHYFLLVQTHLPYILSPNAYRYHRKAAARGSRQILERFKSMKKFVVGMPYCRGIDFLVFIASTTLCIAYIEMQRLQVEGHQTGNGFDFLSEHERWSGVALLCEVADMMNTKAQEEDDHIAASMHQVLQPLNRILLSAFNGKVYRAGPVQEQESGMGGLREGGRVLRINIPHFGTIKVEPYDVSTITSAPSEHESVTSDAGSAEPEASANTSQDNQGLLTPRMSSPSTRAYPHSLGAAFVPPLAASAEDWALQGVDQALFESLLNTDLKVQVEGGDMDVSHSYGTDIIFSLANEPY